MERGGICTDTDVEYWKLAFQEYIRALPLNSKGIWFQFQKEAHEQTWGKICKPMTEARVIFIEKMQDQFLEWIAQQLEVEFLTASQAITLYGNEMNDNETIPIFQPFRWIPVGDQLDFWR